MISETEREYMTHVRWARGWLYGNTPVSLSHMCPCRTCGSDLLRLAQAGADNDHVWRPWLALTIEMLVKRGAPLALASALLRIRNSVA